MVPTKQTHERRGLLPPIQRKFKGMGVVNPKKKKRTERNGERKSRRGCGTSERGFSFRGRKLLR